jgi:hypothetical protein
VRVSNGVETHDKGGYNVRLCNRSSRRGHGGASDKARGGGLQHVNAFGPACWNYPIFVLAYTWAVAVFCEPDIKLTWGEMHNALMQMRVIVHQTK